MFLVVSRQNRLPHSTNVQYIYTHTRALKHTHRTLSAALVRFPLSVIRTGPFQNGIQIIWLGCSIHATDRAHCAAAAGLFVQQHAIIKFGGPRKKWPAAHTTASARRISCHCCAAWPFLMQNASLIIYINERAADFFICGLRQALKVMTVFHCFWIFDALKLQLLSFWSKKVKCSSLQDSPIYISI